MCPVPAGGARHVAIAPCQRLALPWSRMQARSYRSDCERRGVPSHPLLQVVMEREGGNPEFGFLFDIRCPEHLYYRWRLFSLASGDTLRR